MTNQASRSFGIDHPLIAVRDIEAVRERFISLGFNMTPVGKHPWGTSTSLAMFNACLIEIVSIYDESLLNTYPAGEFYFGQHVHQHLVEHEGVALMALHSQDAKEDRKVAERAGFAVAGEVEFGRDVTLPSGDKDRTRTSLVLLPDNEFPRLSLFLCQQHKPELIYVPSWLQHSNSACGYAGISILADAKDHKKLMSKYAGLYERCSRQTNNQQANDQQESLRFLTSNGYIDIIDYPAFKNRFGIEPTQVDGPTIVAVDIRYADEKALLTSLNASGLPYEVRKGGAQLMQPELTGNVIIQFSMDTTTI